MDWTAVGCLLTSALALLAAAISYGKNRQELVDLRGKVRDMSIEIAKLGDIKGSLDLLSQATANATDRQAERREADAKLMGERFEGLRGEVRAFMQGQATAGAKPQPGQRSRGQRQQ